MTRNEARPSKLTAGLVLGAVLGLAALPARALEEQKGEQQAINECDKRLCGILQGKAAAGPDLQCALTKTWARSTLKEADHSQVTWGFGDARCTVDIKISRALLVTAITSPKTYKLWVPAHTANCMVEENGRPHLLKATLEPKIVFKGGKAEKIWINLRHVEGTASIRDWMSAAAQLTDSIGIFHHAMLKSVNGYIYKHCPKYYPLAAAGKPAK
jgi:hypothetical protein